jgi:large conductance mechanosensitive channel
VADSMLAQFMKFLKETNAIALAVAVVIGGAVQKLVSALVSGIFMPILGVILPGGSWRTWSLHLRGESSLAIGDVLGATVDFVIIAWVLYVIVNKLVKVQPAK